MKNKTSQSDRWYGTASKSDKEFIDFISKYVQEPIEHHDPLRSGDIRLVLPSDLGRTKKQTVDYNRPGYGWGPTTFWVDDEVTTKSGQKGKVLGSIWIHNLVRFEGNLPHTGYYAVKVGFGEHSEYYFVKELEGDRIKWSSDGIGMLNVTF